MSEVRGGSGPINLQNIAATQIQPFYNQSLTKKLIPFLWLEAYEATVNMYKIIDIGSKGLRVIILH